MKLICSGSLASSHPSSSNTAYPNLPLSLSFYPKGNKDVRNPEEMFEHWKLGFPIGMFPPQDYSKFHVGDKPTFLFFLIVWSRYILSLLLPSSLCLFAIILRHSAQFDIVEQFGNLAYSVQQRYFDCGDVQLSELRCFKNITKNRFCLLLSSTKDLSHTKYIALDFCLKTTYLRD